MHYRPSIPPPGWLDLEPFIVQRINSGVSQSELAAARQPWPNGICALERARVPRVSPAMVARYREALEAVLAARKLSAREVA